MEGAVGSAFALLDKFFVTERNHVEPFKPFFKLYSYSEVIAPDNASGQVVDYQSAVPAVQYYLSFTFPTEIGAIFNFDEHAYHADVSDCSFVADPVFLELTDGLWVKPHPE